MLSKPAHQMWVCSCWGCASNGPFWIEVGFPAGLGPTHRIMVCWRWGEKPWTGSANLVVPGWVHACTTALYWRQFSEISKKYQTICTPISNQRPAFTRKSLLCRELHSPSERKSYCLSAPHLLLTNMKSGQVLIFLLFSECAHQSFYITGESISNKNKAWKSQSPLEKATLYLWDKGNN